MELVNEFMIVNNSHWALIFPFKYFVCFAKKKKKRDKDLVIYEFFYTFYYLFHGFGIGVMIVQYYLEKEKIL